MKQELFCQIGQHKWEREAKRGRKPINCPEHASSPVAPKKPADKAANLAKARDAKIEKAKQREQEQKIALQQKVEYHRERVEAATRKEEAAYARLEKKKTDKNQDEWLRLNNILLAEVTSLRAAEAKAAA